MLGRIRRDRYANNDDDEPSIQGVGSLLGGDGVSLDGESVQLPSDYDDMSSINTNTLADQQGAFRIVGPGDGDNSTIMGGEHSPNGGANGNADDDTDSGAAAGCLPLWLTDAPTWLKAAIVVSTALLVGAIVLVGVAAALNSQSNSNSSSRAVDGLPTNTLGPGPTPFIPLTPSPSASPSIPVTSPPSIRVTDNPTMPPTRTPSKSPGPTTPGETFVPSTMPSVSPTMVPTSSPSAVPTGQPSLSPSLSPTGAPITEPTSAPVVLTLAPATSAPVDSTLAPVVATLAPVEPTMAPVEPTLAPVVATLAPVEPTLAPIEPTLAPVEATLAPVEPTLAPVEPTLAPVEPTLAPVEPTLAPVTATLPPVIPPVATPQGSKTVFYLVAGRPLDDELELFEDNLRKLPTEADFMVHLGDWNSPFSTDCDEESYQTVDALYEQSSVPVYFVPGDNEYNDCPNIEEAFDFWEEYLLSYETKHWPEPAWQVERFTPEYAENFAFVLRNILYIGINLVGGRVHSDSEWADRQKANLKWIDDSFRDNKPLFDVMVIFAHADPDIETNDDFFEPLFERIEFDYALPTILIHRNLGVESSSIEENFNNIPDFVVLVAEGGIWPPMRVEIDTITGSFVWDQENWYDEL